LIGAMETTAAARMPQVLAQYHKRYPEVQLALETGTTRELIDAVLNYKLEAALIAAPLEHPELDAQIAFEEELVLITDLQQGPIESPQDIRNLTLLVFRAGCRYRQHLEDWVGKLGGVPKRIVEFGTFEAIIGCVAAGMGVSMMPRAVVEQHRSQGVIRIYPLPPDIARAPTLFIRRRDVLESSAMRAFRGTLGEVWRAENREAISSYNGHVAEKGVFGDAVRQF
jgi:DNA-binding transcriptional LysR family regulator